MPAHNKNFPWLSYYAHYNFFEEKMFEHSKVSSYKKIKNGLYEIELINRKKITAFICECYSFGKAEFIEANHNYGEIDAIIINSSWCGYTLELKHHCMKKKIGLFDIRGFMAAINRDEFWKYITKAELEKFEEKGWSLD